MPPSEGLGGDDSDFGALAAAAARAEAGARLPSSVRRGLPQPRRRRRAQLDSAADGVRVRAAEDYASMPRWWMRRRRHPRFLSLSQRYAGATVSVEKG